MVVGTATLFELDELTGATQMAGLDKPVAQIAENLGISDSCLRNG